MTHKKLFVFASLVCLLASCKPSLAFNTLSTYHLTPTSGSGTPGSSTQGGTSGGSTQGGTPIPGPSTQVCTHCNGTGKIGENCDNCLGSGELCYIKCNYGHTILDDPAGMYRGSWCEVCYAKDGSLHIMAATAYKIDCFHCTDGQVYYTCTYCGGTGKKTHLPEEVIKELEQQEEQHYLEQLARLENIHHYEHHCHHH